MSKVLVGIFTVVFVGALAYELFNRTNPDLTKKFENKWYDGLDNFLKPSRSGA